MQDYSTYIYEVETVEKTIPPDGASGGDWYRYVLKKGNSIIYGISQISVLGMLKTAVRLYPAEPLIIEIDTFQLSKLVVNKYCFR